ncbi:MAG: hypothetical protein ACN4G0_19755 [Polyangiales bacterium]
MHGLRCDPTLLGWTRLLDEWVVGLTYDRRDAAPEAVCWDDPAQTVGTLVDAATRVRTFAYRETDMEPTRLSPGGVLRIELQGCAYCVAVDQHWPRSSEDAASLGAAWLEAALRRARTEARDGEAGVGAVFATPHLERSSEASVGARVAEAFIGASRAIRCSGCAFSFPLANERAKYRYGGEAHPGALLLVQAAG